MRRLLLPCSLLLVGAMSAGCTDEPEPTEGSDKSSASSSETPSETPSKSETPNEGETTGEGPVAGAGAGLSPENAKEWCGVITPEQLSALTGYEVTGVWGRREGVNTCSTELPGLELNITWGSEPTKKSFEQYAAGWDRPAGVFDVAEVELPNGRPAVVATQPVPETGHAGAVVDGRVIQVLVSEVIPDEASTVEDLGAMARQILAVYAG
ncbi:hypothetical protein EXE58_06300 [Nocardioides seonyuensis]|uniref:DUF3558 domain-containing protein n=1 Tax=Nocardioides seonyuensis TaxID=2518371 RepID=A0A4P7ID77_9ACTN|nr:hypothetical protein [Nocardioides seonyuensis]QBX55105.1 hypothetical protein EXE58_06300 [Nocardioides seonyuensis]